MENQDALHRLVAEVAHGELVFSTHADVALQVRIALDDPNVHIDQAARLVQAEPLLSARVVALANSVAFNRSGKPLSDVRSAVSRLGLNLVRALSTALIMRQISIAPTPADQALGERLWEHSSHVAALAYVLARRVSRQNPDKAMFAGIVHEVGSFYLISRASAYPGLIANGVAPGWERGIEATVGKAVLKALAVPEDIASAVSGLWQGNLTLPPRDLADTLFLANCLTPIASPLSPAADSDKEELIEMTRMILADETLAMVIHESAEELEAIANSLRI